jgi:hypothetical protein
MMAVKHLIEIRRYIFAFIISGLTKTPKLVSREFFFECAKIRDLAMTPAFESSVLTFVSSATYFVVVNTFAGHRSGFSKNLLP